MGVPEVLVDGVHVELLKELLMLNLRLGGSSHGGFDDGGLCFGGLGKCYYECRSWSWCFAALSRLQPSVVGSAA